MYEEVHQTLIFKVIVDEGEQYSLWLIDREEPPGWHDADRVQGSAMECLAYIKEWYMRQAQNRAKGACAS